jgi:hypothetical protein
MLVVQYRNWYRIRITDHATHIRYLDQVRVDRSSIQRSLNVEEEEVQPPNTNMALLVGYRGSSFTD